MQIRLRMEIAGASNPGVVIEDQKTGYFYDPTVNIWLPPDGDTLSDGMVNRIGISLNPNQPTKGRFGAVFTVADDSSIRDTWMLYPFDFKARASGAAATLTPLPLPGMTIFYPFADQATAILGGGRL